MSNRVFVVLVQKDAKIVLNLHDVDAVDKDHPVQQRGVGIPWIYPPPGYDEHTYTGFKLTAAYTVDEFCMRA
jgi:hypothetical protein